MPVKMYYHSFCLGFHLPCVWAAPHCYNQTEITFASSSLALILWAPESPRSESNLEQVNRFMPELIHIFLVIQHLNQQQVITPSLNNVRLSLS